MSKKTVNDSTRKATATRSSIRSAPSAAATGIVVSRAARAASAAIITGRRRKRSTHAPASRPKSRCGRPAAAASTPKAIGEAPRLKAASSGSATAVNCEPTADVDCATHSRAKSP
jgi:hypothetical protein